MIQTSYNQPLISIEEQIDLLKSEGLGINDDKKVQHLLENISFFRFKSYLMPFPHTDFACF